LRFIRVCSHKGGDNKSEIDKVPKGRIRLIVAAKKGSVLTKETNVQKTSTVELRITAISCYNLVIYDMLPQ